MLLLKMVSLRCVRQPGLTEYVEKVLKLFGDRYVINFA